MASRREKGSKDYNKKQMHLAANGKYYSTPIDCLDVYDEDIDYQDLEILAKEVLGLNRKDLKDRN